MSLWRLAGYATLGGLICCLVGLCLPAEVGPLLFFPASLCGSVLGMTVAHLIPDIVEALRSGRPGRR